MGIRERQLASLVFGKKFTYGDVMGINYKRRDCIYEYDVIRIRPNGEVYEYELKTSWDSISQEMTKEKHLPRRLKCNYFYIIGIDIPPKNAVKYIPKRYGILYLNTESSPIKFSIYRRPSKIKKGKVKINIQELAINISNHYRYSNFISRRCRWFTTKEFLSENFSRFKEDLAHCP